MNFGLYQSASTMVGLQRWQDAISANLANSSVNGFKKTDFSFESIKVNPTAEISDDVMSVEAPLSTEGWTFTNFGNGRLMHTGVSTDVAIGNDGFFKVEAENGRTVFTRNGHFHFNEEGILVDGRGRSVQGEGGIISKQPGDGTITVDSDGRIQQNNTEIGKFDVVRFENPENLVPATGGFMIDPSVNAGESPSESPGITQGFLESSNVSPISEMTHMISISRAYEVNQKLIQQLDENTEKAIQNLTAR